MARTDDTYYDQEDDTGENDAQPLSQSSERHCAWCGDDPDEHGSHGICPDHAEELFQSRMFQSRTRVKIV